MKHRVFKLLNLLGVKSDRTKNITKHIGISVFFKIGSVIANFLLVPLTINFLDTVNYGIWLTLSSFISWFVLFDVGLGNGLRNKLAESVALGNQKLAQAYVSTTYYAITIVSILLFIIFFSVNFFVDWTKVFSTSDLLYHDLSILMPVVFGFFCLQLVVRLITTVYLAKQHHSIQVKVQFITQTFSLFVIWLLTKTTGSSLLIFGSVFSALPFIILLLLNIFSFLGNYKTLKPKYTLFNKRYLKDLIGISFKFFIIQIAALILFSTDNFLISKFFGPANVVPYNIAFKYFSIVIMGYTIIITPYWSSFTEAFAKKDFMWIKKSVINIQKIWVLVPLILVVMVFLSDSFYKFWVGDKIKVPMNLSMAMALYVTLITYNMIYSYFINGIGKIKLNLVFSLVSMIINIPLSIFFGKYLGWGSTGVILATCFCLLYALPFLPIQYNRLINGKAKGIWNK